MAYIDLRCPVKLKNGLVCGHHLLDVDECSDAIFIVNHRNKDHKENTRDNKRAIRFTVRQGRAEYEILPPNYRKEYVIGGAIGAQ